MATVAVLLVISALIGVATVQLIVPSLAERICLRRFPQGFLYSLAVLELLTATFLMVPATRIWGIAITAGIIMANLISLLYSRRFIWACAAFALLLALIPVAVAE